MARLPREHGTVRGYRQHTWRGEETCQPCKSAIAEAFRGKTAKPATGREKPKPVEVSAERKITGGFDRLGKMGKNVHSVMVVCVSCKRRSYAPRKLVGKNTRIEACDECRPKAKLAG